jgi:hypothetical protein
MYLSAYGAAQDEPIKLTVERSLAGSDHMFPSPAIPELILTECPDRRARARLAHRELVQIDGRPVIGRDISAKGLSVIMAPTVSIGEVVHVSLSLTQGLWAARVARVDGGSDPSIVGLEFLR